MTSDSRSITSQELASWIFGTALFLFLAWVFIAAPAELPSYKHQLLGVFISLLAGIFSFFLTGSVLAKAVIRIPGGRLGVQGVGGIAVMILAGLWWTSPNAPISEEPNTKQLLVYGKASDLGEDWKDVRPEEWQDTGLTVHAGDKVSIKEIPSQTDVWYTGQGPAHVGLTARGDENWKGDPAQRPCPGRS